MCDGSTYEIKKNPITTLAAAPQRQHWFIGVYRTLEGITIGHVRRITHKQERLRYTQDWYQKIAAPGLDTATDPQPLKVYLR